MHQVKLIVAIDENRGMSKNGDLPWDLPDDRKYFREHIKDGPIVMGWKTFESNKFKPFGKGRNYIVSHKKNFHGVEIINDLNEFMRNLDEDIWVIGGGQIFRLALPFATNLFITQIEGDYGCDVSFPEYLTSFKKIYESKLQINNNILFRFQQWESLASNNSR